MRYKPMLAYPVSDKPIDYNKPVFLQPKLDGVRCLIQYEGGGICKAYSRTGKEWKNIDHILMNLTEFFVEHPNIVLDGELYNHDLKDDFEKIISLVRKTKPTDEDRVESAEMVQFHCYDTIMKHMPYHDRAKFLISNLRDSYCVRFLPAFSVDCEERSKLYHQENLGAGYEGSILRTNDVYKCGRSWSLRKFKDFSDAEATITGFVEGKGKRKGTLGKFLMVDDDGNEFGCPPGKGYNYQDMKNLLFRAPHYIGAKATFTYFERTKAGSYRHPLFKCIRDYE
tara:strand:- start:560 stop:1405 length:846 start_codon:yes stop_codon:yes gene_type:complete